MDNNNVDISVVIPVLNEEKNIEELSKQLKKPLDALRRSYELIFVDDGSTDNSFSILERLHKIDPKVKVIQFRKNYGKSAVFTAGFKEARGEFVFTIDGDLQDDPKEIPRFLEEIDKGYDLVSGWKIERKDSLSKIIPSKLFNLTTSLLTGVRLHDFNCGFKCYRKEVVKEIKIYGELYRYIPVLVAWRGFRVTEIKVAHRPREFGKSKFGIGRFTKGFLDFLTVTFLTKYARRPLHFFGITGSLLFTVGFLICSYLSFYWFTGHRLGNRPLLLFGVLLILSGIQFISIGLVGEMITEKFYKDGDDFTIRSKLC